MPPNMMNALVGSRPKVTGNSTATVSAGPMPGRTPIAVPSVVPISAHERFATVSAPANPAPSESSVLTGPRARPSAALRARTSSRSQPSGEHADRERQLQQGREQEIGGGRDRNRVRCVAHRVAVIERACDEPEQQRGSDEKSGSFGENDVEEHAD